MGYVHDVAYWKWGYCTLTVWLTQNTVVCPQILNITSPQPASHPDSQIDKHIPHIGPTTLEIFLNVLVIQYYPTLSWLFAMGSRPSSTYGCGPSLERKLYAQPGPPPIRWSSSGKKSIPGVILHRSRWLFWRSIGHGRGQKLRIQNQQLFHVTCQREAFCFNLSPPYQ